MSIIHDALKKTQSSLGENSEKNDSPPPIQPPLETTPSRTPVAATASDKTPVWMWTIWGILFAVIVGSFITTFFLIYSEKKDNLAKMQEQAKQQELARQQALAKMVAATNASLNVQDSGELRLNGIMTTDGQPIALINNRIVKAGDYIGNKRVVAIGEDKVELFSNGKVEILSIQP